MEIVSEKLSGTDLMRQASITIATYMDEAKKNGILNTVEQISFASACAQDFHTAIQAQATQQLTEAVSRLADKFEKI